MSVLGNLNVAVIGENGYGRNIGKRGTESDMAFYNLKRGEHSVTAMEPSRFPERLSSLFYSLAPSPMAVIVVRELNAALGEAILAADALGVEKGIFILMDYRTPEEISPLVKGTAAEGYDMLQDADPVDLRERLLDLAVKMPAVPSETGSVPVDHFFNVKGIGTVVLGTVMSGTVRRHDQLRLLPGTRTAVLRSIQRHDDDSAEAHAGDRVGLALKNVTVEDLDRGMVLSTGDLLVSDEPLLRVRPNRYWKRPIVPGAVLHIGHWMQFLPARVTDVRPEGDHLLIRLSLDRGLVTPPGANVLVSHLDAGSPRIVGPGTLMDTE